MAQARVRSGEVHPLLAACDAPARTTALIKTRELEVIRLVIRAGESLPEHAAPGELTIFGLAGRLALVTREGTLEIGPGDFVHLGAQAPHAVYGVQDASALLTLSLPSPVRPAPGTGRAPA